MLETTEARQIQNLLGLALEVLCLGVREQSAMKRAIQRTQRRMFSKRAGEDIWRMPLTEGLKDQLKSDVADMKNTGDRLGGAITGALFLQEFVGDTPWAHLDIAGPATSSKEKGILSKGGTGFGVATLSEFLAHVPTASERTARKAAAKKKTVR